MLLPFGFWLKNDSVAMGGKSRGRGKGKGDLEDKPPKDNVEDEECIGSNRESVGNQCAINITEQSMGNSCSPQEGTRARAI